MLKKNLLISILAAFAIAMPGRAQTDYLNAMGLPELRATTNLNGAGIRVAQPEANETGGNPPAFEINPAAVGQPSGLFSYYSLLGSATGYPNAVGVESSHGNTVAGLFYGPAVGVATNLAHVDSFDADYFINACIVSNLVAYNAAIVNQSFVDTDTNSQSAYDDAYDNYALQHKILFVSGAGNLGLTGPRVLPPSTSYNGISVSAYYGGINYGGIGPTPYGGRCKPDLTGLSQFTSASTPLVSGAAALLMQGALRGDGGGDTNSAVDMRTIKAVLLNGAVKPAGWTNSSVSPLDARHGAGLVNVFNAWQQLAGGRQASLVSSLVNTGAAHPPTGATGTVTTLSGWDFRTNTSSVAPGLDSVQHYYFNVSNANPAATFNLTATLVWNRQINQSAINNLNLFLYNCANSNLVACSTSLVDNVEHIYQPSLPPGRYDLQVWKAGGTGIVSTAEPCALAFAFVPSPTLALTGGANPALTWPQYPAGFLVEARTNLASGAWSTNGVPALTLTNGLNSIRLNPTNAAQFFRLRSPSF
jgi:hypothetical protein